MRHRWLVTAVFAELAIAVVAAACGARTGLSVGDDTASGGQGGEGGVAIDAAPDRDAAVDAPPDSPEDVPDVVQEGLPECDPEALYIYLITSETVLYRFDPATNTATNKGFISCPDGTTPFSMGVDRTGKAYTVYQSGVVYELDVATTVCKDIQYPAGQAGFLLFGMGFAIDDDLMGESLYVAEITFGSPSQGLGRIDTDTLELDFISPFSETFGPAMELTSSDDGRLWGYNLDEGGAGGWVIQIDKETATILEATFLPVGDASSALAFAQWGGDFYIFTSNGAGTTVTKYDPDDGSVGVVTTLAETVVGAGVSTCKTGGP